MLGLYLKVYTFNVYTYKNTWKSTIGFLEQSFVRKTEIAVSCEDNMVKEVNIQ